ncbi:MAG: hypothetical protein ACYC7B_07220 [Burkholderiales bacterium]
MTTPTCRECRFFASEPGELERALPGINILSSAYGSVRADTAICEQRGIFVTPALACPDFLGRPAPGFALRLPPNIPDKP